MSAPAPAQEAFEVTSDNQAAESDGEGPEADAEIQAQRRRIILTRMQLDCILDYHKTVKGCAYLGRTRLVARYEDRIRKGEEELQRALRNDQTTLSCAESNATTPLGRAPARHGVKSGQGDSDGDRDTLPVPWALDTDQIVQQLLRLRALLPPPAHAQVLLRVCCDRLTVAALLESPLCSTEEKLGLITSVPPPLLPDLTAYCAEFLAAGQLGSALRCVLTGRATAATELVTAAVRAVAVDLLRELLRRGASPNKGAPLSALLDQVPAQTPARLATLQLFPGPAIGDGSGRGRRASAPSHQHRLSLGALAPPRMPPTAAEEPQPTGVGLPVYAVPYHDTPFVCHCRGGGDAGEQQSPEVLAFGPAPDAPPGFAVVRTDCPLFRDKGYFECAVDAAFLSAALANGADIGAVAGWCDPQFDLYSGVGLGMDPEGRSWGIGLRRAPADAHRGPTPLHPGLLDSTGTLSALQAEVAAQPQLALVKLHRGRWQPACALHIPERQPGDTYLLQCWADLVDKTISFGVDGVPLGVSFIDFGYELCAYPAAAATTAGGVQCPAQGAPAPLEIIADPRLTRHGGPGGAVPPIGKIESGVRLLLAQETLDPNQCLPAPEGDRRWQLFPASLGMEATAWFAIPSEDRQGKGTKWASPPTSPRGHLCCPANPTESPRAPPAPASPAVALQPRPPPPGAGPRRTQRHPSTASALPSESPGLPPLQCALYQMLLPAARLIVDHPRLQLDRPDHLGNTALIVAGARGATDIVGALLRRGARPDLVNAAGLTALHAAVIGGSVAAAHMVLASAEHLPNCVELLSRPAGVSRDTPATLAVRRGMEGIVRNLLAVGADCASANAHGQTPLLLACKYARGTLAQHLLDEDDPGASASLAVVDVNCKERQAPQGTALVYAAAADLAEVVTALLKRGASVSHRIKDPVLNPLCVAIRARAVSAALAVIPATVAVGDLDWVEPKGGHTAISLACAEGLPEVVSALLRAGCDPNIVAKTGVPPLLSAVAHGQHATVAAFLSASRGNLLLDQQDRGGDTALGRAAAAGMSDIVEELCEKGADVNICNRAGYPALALAIEHDNEDAALRLIRLNHTSLSLSCQCGPKRLGYMQLAFNAGMKRVCQLLTELGAPAPPATLQAVRDGNIPPPRDRSAYRVRGPRQVGPGGLAGQAARASVVSSAERNRPGHETPRGESQQYAARTSTPQIHSATVSRHCPSPENTPVGNHHMADTSTALLDQGKPPQRTLPFRPGPQSVMVPTYVIAVGGIRSAARLRQVREAAERERRDAEAGRAEQGQSDASSGVSQDSIREVTPAAIDDCGLARKSTSADGQLGTTAGSAEIILDVAEGAAADPPEVALCMIGAAVAAAASFQPAAARAEVREWERAVIADWLATSRDEMQAYKLLRRLAAGDGDETEDARWASFCAGHELDCTPQELLVFIWPLVAEDPDEEWAAYRQACRQEAAPRSTGTRLHDTRSFRGGPGQAAAGGDRPQPQAAAMGEVRRDFLLSPDRERSMSPALLRVFSAVVDGRGLEAARLIRAAPGTCLAARTARGMSLLHLAAVVDCAAVVPALVQAGADTVGAWEDGCTPLVLALMNGADESALSLIEAAGPACGLSQTTTLHHETPLGLALRLGSDAVALELLYAGAPRPSGMPLASRGAARAQPGGGDKTPHADSEGCGELLVRAVESGCAAAMQRLVEMDWDKGCSKTVMQRVLCACCTHRAYAFLSALIARGHDPAAGCEWDTDGPLPVRLIQSVRSDSPVADRDLIAKILRDHFVQPPSGGALAAWRSSGGQTVLHCACNAQALRVVDALLGLTGHGRELSLSERDKRGKVAVDLLHPSESFERPPRSTTVVKLLRRTDVRRARRWLTAGAAQLGQRAFVALCCKMDPALLGTERDAAKGRASDDVADIAERFWSAVIVLMWFSGPEERELCVRSISRAPLHWLGQLRGVVALAVCAFCCFVAVDPSPPPLGSAASLRDQRTITPPAGTATELAARSNAGLPAAAGESGEEQPALSACLPRQPSENMSARREREREREEGDDPEILMSPAAHARPFPAVPSPLGSDHSPSPTAGAGSGAAANAEQVLSERMAAAFRQQSSTEPLAQLLELAARYDHSAALRWGLRGLPTDHPARGRAVFAAAAASRPGCLALLVGSLRSLQHPMRGASQRQILDSEGGLLFDYLLMGRASSEPDLADTFHFLLHARASLSHRCLHWIQEHEGGLDYRTPLLRDSLLHIACLNNQLRIADVLLRSEQSAGMMEPNALGMRPIDYTSRATLWRMLRAAERRLSLVPRLPVYLLPWPEVRRQATDKRSGGDPSQAEAAATLLRTLLEELFVAVDTDEECDYAGHWALSLTAACAHKAAQAAKIRTERSLAGVPPGVDDSILTEADVHRYTTQHLQQVLRHILMSADLASLPVMSVPVTAFWPYAKPRHTVHRLRWQQLQRPAQRAGASRPSPMQDHAAPAPPLQRVPTESALPEAAQAQRRTPDADS